MGHKVHPKVHRLSTIYSWDSKWFSKNDFAKNLREDVLLRDFLRKELREASLDKVEIERNRNNITVTIYSGKPGVVIGRSGAGIDVLKKKILEMLYRGKRVALNIQVSEVKQPALSSAIVAEQMAMDIEKRLPFSRVMKQAIERVSKAGAKGVKVATSGRLNGAEISRTEKLSSGKIPLQNLRADIDFACATARTIYGAIGVKVWIYKGDVFESEKKSE
ncbi:MAG: 30S ribosomal protein S3 [uncultured bacterium]|nr:MAG: 30S ribosomal protein S3 [uncultured bacterium]HBD05269.1 30S ribosomal protein S3 [Candidatus Uhrbacteria bacterium]